MNLDDLQTDPLATVADYYSQCLPDKAEAFANQVGATGFADRSLGKHIPHRRTKLGRSIRDKLTEIGIYKPNGRETLRGYVTEPIDQNGRVVAIRGHKLDPHASGPGVIVVGSLPETHVDAAIKSAPDEDLAIEDGQIVFRRENRRYRVRGLEKNASTTTLKVAIMASRDGLVHLDSLDLVKARSRNSFIKAVATELYVDEDIVKRDIGKLLLSLETIQAERIEQLKAPKVVQLTDQEEAEALELLRSPNLVERIADDLDKIGIVGEKTNKLAGYIAAVSRKLDTPLAIVIQSSSSAGKTSLMDAVLSMVPDEDLLRLTNLSPQSLYYLDSIKHKILAVSEDEGVSQSAYSLKLLQSEGKLRHAVVSREGGRMETQHYEVEGPVSMFLTTTALDLDEELMNRCLVLSVDESRQQTKAIHRRQQVAQTTEGKRASEQAEKIRKLHQNAQRLLKSVEIVNPFADKLTFPNDRTRMRRDFAKYLSLIKAITLLHQYQRTEVTRDDIALANKLAAEILGRSLDELSPQTRVFLTRLHDFVKQSCEEQDLHRSEFRFTRRDVRDALGWSQFQVHTHLTKLVELEYVLGHCGNVGRRHVYELLFDGQCDGKTLAGLVDVSQL
ncbi:hypothetical protein [Rhodopirellula sp. MGV]|uniref:hypothetical protein n=1 Tax=Rhodopirellula sp. MGV TaxID=2023130 RepID=UPI000B96AF4B|nr:hypothetical protein [Rhodopirellula sp. MGV]OYP36779.1 hypothetical protein CGZ80_06935 [Rhodopirellula sp. MGV]PNY37517.1 hypothetical protein C2E31_07235 [Rhodopirellula baltica]